MKINPLYQAIGSRIHEAREKQGITLDELERLRFQVVWLEQGKGPITLRVLYDLAERFGCSVHTLLPDNWPRGMIEAIDVLDVPLYCIDCNTIISSNRRIASNRKYCDTCRQKRQRQHQVHYKRLKRRKQQVSEASA